MVRLDDVDVEAMAVCFVVLWECMSSEAAGLSSEECVQRSAAEWSEESAALSAGSLSEAVRCVVRATLWECLSDPYTGVWEAARSVALAVDDWREYHKLPRGRVPVVEVDGAPGEVYVGLV